uniref:Uncharacterized protein n=1 Tax=Arundo donax TaxID=35708 RepID=A0A0A9EI79_ARUDO
MTNIMSYIIVRIQARCINLSMPCLFILLKSTSYNNDSQF